MPDANRASVCVKSSCDIRTKRRAHPYRRNPLTHVDSRILLALLAAAMYVTQALQYARKPRRLNWRNARRNELFLACKPGESDKCTCAPSPVHGTGRKSTVAEIAQGKQRQIARAPTLLEPLAVTPENEYRNEFVESMLLDPGKAKPGYYQLTVQVTDIASGATTARITQFRLEN